MYTKSEQTHNATKIDNDNESTTEPPPWKRQQRKPPCRVGDFIAFYLYKILAPDSVKAQMLSSHEGLTIAMYYHGNNQTETLFQLLS